MSAIQGTWKNGHVVLDGPTDWPDGSRLIVAAMPAPNSIDSDAADQSDDPESIAKWLAEFDSIPPWEITPEEETRWQADRQLVKEYTITKMKQRFDQERS